MKPNDFLIVMLLLIVFCVAAGHGNLQHHALINL